MKATIRELIPGAAPEALFEHIATLDRYPAWMRLVHKVTPLPPEDGRPAWWVELRARVGPIARSKQLRMERTVFVPGKLVKFERVQADNRDHAEWILIGEVSDSEQGTMLTMRLEYTGELWSKSVLGRVLDDEVRRGAATLTRLLAASGQPTR